MGDRVGFVLVLYGKENILVPKKFLTKRRIYAIIFVMRIEREGTSCLDLRQSQIIQYTRAVIIGMALFNASLNYADL